MRDADAPASMPRIFADEESSQPPPGHSRPALWASAHLTPGLAATGFRSGARSGRCRFGRNGTAGETRAVFPIDDRRRRKDSGGHLARRQIRDAHAGAEAAAQTGRGAVIVMVLMLMRCMARHVFVIMRARLAGHSRWRNRVRDGGARQKCQRAHQRQKFRRQPPHAAKASTVGRPGQGPLYNQSAKERRADSRFLFSGVNTLVSPYRIDANPE